MYVNHYTVNVQVLLYTSHIGMVVGRVRMNLLDTDAYAQCFKALFEQVASDHPTFKVGESLTGIIADWSDQQSNGLERAVGKLVAKEILKGCQVYNYIKFSIYTTLNTCDIQVHFIRSLQRVAKKLNSQYKEGKEAFVAVGQQILKAKSADEVMTLFDVLRGEKSINDISIPKCARTVDTKEWKGAATWVDWWVRKRHLCK